jgi:3-hydroxyacyl-[acyl-carrier-protein] dehydratase
MQLKLVDSIVEQTPDRIVAIRNVIPSEDYLGDHFPGFPVLPGVMMIETMVQAARIMLSPRGNDRLVLGQVKTLKYGSFVRPGESLEVEVTLTGSEEDGSYQCRGIGRVRRPDAPAGAEAETAVSGRFTMRPIRTA